jgi:hypothetical protein
MLMLLDGEMAVVTEQGHLDTCRAVQKFNELSQAGINVAAARHLTHSSVAKLFRRFPLRLCYFAGHRDKSNW